MWQQTGDDSCRKEGMYKKFWQEQNAESEVQSTAQKGRELRLVMLDYGQKIAEQSRTWNSSCWGRIESEAW